MKSLFKKLGPKKIKNVKKCIKEDKMLELSHTD